MTVPNPAPALRPLSSGERIDASIKIYGRNLPAMAKAMLLVAVPTGALSALIALSEGSTTSGTTTTLAPTPAHNAVVLGGTAINEVVGLVATAIGTATVFWLIITAYLGQPATWRASLGVGVRRMGSVLWITVLSLVAMFAPAVIIGGGVAVPVAAHATPVGVTVALVLGLGWVVFVVWFWVFSRLAIPCMFLEGVRGRAAITRSHRLVRGQWWSVFGTQVLASIIQWVFTAVVGGILLAVLLSSQDQTTRLAASFAVDVVSSVLVLPFTSAVYVVLAIDAKVRKEGFDLEVLAGRFGTAPTATALSFMRPAAPAPYGWPPPGSYGVPAGPSGGPGGPYGGPVGPYGGYGRPVGPSGGPSGSAAGPWPSAPGGWGSPGWSGNPGGPWQPIPPNPATAAPVGPPPIPPSTPTAASASPTPSSPGSGTTTPPAPPAWPAAPAPPAPPFPAPPAWTAAPTPPAPPAWPAAPAPPVPPFPGPAPAEAGPAPAGGDAATPPAGHDVTGPAEGADPGSGPPSPPPVPPYRPPS